MNEDTLQKGGVRSDVSTIRSNFYTTRASGVNDSDLFRSAVYFPQGMWIIVPLRWDEADVNLQPDQFKDRLGRHLLNHYMQLHITLVGVTLAAAGYSAVSLFAAPEGRSDHGFLPLLLWFASLLAVGVAYLGASIGVPALPAATPRIWDLVIPLATGISQFALFAVLTNSVAKFDTSTDLFEAWLIGMAIFGATAVMAILRARSLMPLSAYDAALHPALTYYRTRLFVDVVGASVISVLSTFGASIFAAGWQVSELWRCALAFMLVAPLLVGIFMHHVTAKGIWDRIP